MAYTFRVAARNDIGMRYVWFHPASKQVTTKSFSEEHLLTKVMP